AQQLNEIGHRVRDIVADYCSSEGVALTSDNIDWDPVMLQPGAIMPSFSMHIETYDYQARVAKLTKEVMHGMKAEITGSVQAVSKFRPKDEPWLWLVYVSQKGPHV